MKNRRIPLIIGLALALVTGALLLTYVTSLRHSTVAGATKAVLVAKLDIAPRSAVSADMFSIEQRTTTQVDPDAISDPKQLAGQFTVAEIPVGGIATTSKLGLATALPARLAIGMRAVSIAVDNVKAVAGLITPGDRVDVIAVATHNDEASLRGSTIMRGLLVLAVGTDVNTNTTVAGPLSIAAPTLTTLTLAVTPSQADLLTGADMNAVLRLALRNPREPIRSFPVENLRLAKATTTTASNPSPSFTMPQTTTAATTTAAAPQTVSNPAPVASGVLVIVGDAVTTPGTSGK